MFSRCMMSYKLLLVRDRHNKGVFKMLGERFTISYCKVLSYDEYVVNHQLILNHCDTLLYCHDILTEQYCLKADADSAVWDRNNWGVSYKWKWARYRKCPDLPCHAQAAVRPIKLVTDYSSGVNEAVAPEGLIRWKLLQGIQAKILNCESIRH